MGTDRELLEAAAKAAGIEVEFRVFSDSSFICFQKGGNCFHDEWNPLEDDGDALRLAVKLRMDVRLDDPNAATSGWTEYQDCAPTRDGRGPWYWKEFAPDGDPYASTRRAIVRAAAEIGKGLRPFPSDKEIRENWT